MENTAQTSTSLTMCSVKEAKHILAKNIPKMPVRSVPLALALNKVVAEPVKAKLSVPSFDNSAMDGYAFRYQNKKTTFEIGQTIPAGSTKEIVLNENEAARIFTGAPIPNGADTVVQQELCSITNQIIHFDVNLIKKGANVRYAGSQNQKGDIILEQGALIRASTIGLLASTGVHEVPVFETPSVGVIVTGDELQEIGNPLGVGQIYNSNEPTLKALLKNVGIEKVESVCVSDCREALLIQVAAFLEIHDILILSGGISVGDYDFVHDVLKQSGVETLFYKVKQKPGKPLFAGKKGKKLVFALPGNPASVISCFYQYVKPCLLGAMGHLNVFNPDAVLQLTNDVETKKGLTYFLKAKKIFKKVRVLAGQESFNLLSFAEADCLAVVDEETELLPKDSFIKVYFL